MLKDVPHALERRLFCCWGATMNGPQGSLIDTMVPEEGVGWGKVGGLGTKHRDSDAQTCPDATDQTSYPG